ncbi:MAG: hypothetical protein ABI217_08785 [Chthoniobacterales bacterium]
MTATELRKLWHATPFVPFNIILAGSEKLPVPQPGFFALSPKGRIAHIWQEDDDYTVVDVMLITAVETTRNGSKAQRRRRR